MYLFVMESGCEKTMGNTLKMDSSTLISNGGCCRDYHTPNCNDSACNDMCVNKNFCNGGHCKIISSKHYCHCAC